MNTQIIFLENCLFAAILIGAGATLFMDLAALLMKRFWGIASLDYCLVGRWISHMPSGKFKQRNIFDASKKKGECILGWTAHYVIGLVFAFTLILATSGSWLKAPTLLPALLFGIVTVVFPYFVMQPGLGFGIAGSKTPNPRQARLRSLLAHTLFGVGLYLSALANTLF